MMHGVICSSGKILCTEIKHGWSGEKNHSAIMLLFFNLKKYTFWK